MPKVKVIEVRSGNIGDAIKQASEAIGRETGQGMPKELQDILGQAIGQIIEAEATAELIEEGLQAVKDAVEFIAFLGNQADDYLEHAKTCEGCAERVDFNEKMTTLTTAALEAVKALNAFVAADIAVAKEMGKQEAKDAHKGEN